MQYDAQAHALVRVSIGEGGFNDNGNVGIGDASIATPVVGAATFSVPMRSDPTMSDNGAFVFFDSPIALTSRALNDVPIGPKERLAQNVYEYHEGHVSLISDGKDTSPEGHLAYNPVELLGSDTSGSNVFFTTFDQLVPEDTDTQRDIYDAHVCSVEKACPSPKPAPPAPCEGEACHGTAPGSPVGRTPGSESFNGPGNLSPVGPPSPRPKTAAQIRTEKLAKALRPAARNTPRSEPLANARRAKPMGLRRRAGPGEPAAGAQLEHRKAI